MGRVIEPSSLLATTAGRFEQAPGAEPDRGGVFYGVAAVAFAFMVDFVKVPVFNRFKIA
jgi:hypothetical protein